MDSLSSNTPQNNTPKRKPRCSEYVTLTCTYCQKIYNVRESYALRSKTHYCSRECYQADNKGEIRQCLYCGKDIYVTRCHFTQKNYCSHDCHSKHRQKEKLTIACRNCGKTFETLPTSPKQTFCSQQCSQVYRTGPRMHNYKGNSVTCTCAWCNSEFQIPEAWVKKGEGKFCSASCRSRYTVCKQGGMVSSIELAVKDELEACQEVYFHQHRIGRFLVDFYLPQRNLVIECDGTYWHSLEKNRKNDLKKNAYMAQAGINLVRLSEPDIRTNCASIVQHTLSHYPLLPQERSL